MEFELKPDGEMHRIEGEYATEFLLQYIADTLRKVLPESIRLLKLRLYETYFSSTDWKPL